MTEHQEIQDEDPVDVSYDPDPEDYEKYADFFENAAIPMHWVGPDGTVLHANQAELDALGYTRDEYIGQHIAKFHADQDVIEDILDRLTSNEELQDYEARMVRKDGTIRHVLIDSSVNWKDGEFINTRCVTRDITERKEFERQLRESEQRYRTLAESFPNGIVTLFDTDLEYRLAAGHAFDHLPVSSEDVTNHTPREVWGDEAADALKPMMRAALDGEAQSVELEYVGRDWAIHAVPITDEEGKVLNGMTVAQDITERKEREETIAAREQALRNAYEIIADGNRSVSEQFDALLEVGREHLGTDYATFSHIHDDQYEFERVAVDPEIDLEAGESTGLIELPICERVFQTGNPLVLSDVAAEAPELVDTEWGIACYLGAPVVVNDVPYGTFCFYDIEPRSEAFSDWEQTFVELLSDWVGAELTRQQTTEQLQQQNEQLEEFANVVSHDLRSPLNVAAGRLELAQDEHDSEHLREIETAHTRMKTLIDDLLTLAREGNEVTDHTSVDLSTMAETCWATVETADATLVTGVDRTIQADAGRLKQLFENLMRNAVEHSGSGVTITIGELDEGFYIEDDGPGIPEEDRADVFEMGFSTNTNGTGFGLSIAKQIAEAHNWEICVTEGTEGGARFEITGGDRLISTTDTDIEKETSK